MKNLKIVGTAAYVLGTMCYVVACATVLGTLGSANKKRLGTTQLPHLLFFQVPSSDWLGMFLLSGGAM